MTLVFDPEGNELRTLWRLVDYSDQDVLEVGCGDGRVTWYYAHQARSVGAFDPDATAIERARTNTPAELHERIHFWVGDAAADPLPPQAYDIALLTRTLC